MMWGIIKATQVDYYIFHIPYTYIVLLACGENVLKFHFFTFIIEKFFPLLAITSFHSIHMQTFSKNIHGYKIIY